MPVIGQPKAFQSIRAAHKMNDRVCKELGAELWTTRIA
jgi:hypothetical protein